jgi:hypothetical protein
LSVDTTDSGRHLLKSGKKSYMRSVEEYRNQAAECASLAQKVSDLHDKAFWLFLAEAWLWFADDASNLTVTVPPPEESPGGAD